MKKEPTVTSYLDTRHPKLDGTYPVQIRVTADRKSKYYRIAFESKGLSLSKEDFIKVMDFNIQVRGELKKARNTITEEETAAKDIIKEIPTFTFQAFDNRYRNKVEPGDVVAAYEGIIKSKREHESKRIGTASSYECSMKSLQKFFLNKLSKTDIQFSDITTTNLEKYVYYLRAEGCSDATAGIYLRNLRAVYKQAIREGQARQESYPFGVDKFEIPTGEGRNIALTMGELKLIYHYDAKGNELKEWARDIFIFTYLCNGMNLIDIARLKYKNIKGNEIIFVRTKTEFTRKKGKREIVCKINSDIQRIIDRWGTKPIKPDNYIFDILKLDTPLENIRKLVQNANGVINDYLKKIAEDCKITKSVTTYSARHTFASIGTAVGIPLAYISQDLGHSDTKTTQAYISQIETDETEEARRKMTDFNI